MKNTDKIYLIAYKVLFSVTAVNIIKKTTQVDTVTFNIWNSLQTIIFKMPLDQTFTTRNGKSIPLHYTTAGSKSIYHFKRHIYS